MPPTDQADERHDVPAISEQDRVGCENWLRHVGFLYPGEDDEIWEKIKTNWIAFLAATCRIPHTTVAPLAPLAPLAPSRKVVRFSSGDGFEGESAQERRDRLRNDQKQRMAIQASFWHHLEGLEGLTERWPRQARAAIIVQWNQQCFYNMFSIPRSGAVHHTG